MKLQHIQKLQRIIDMKLQSDLQKLQASRENERQLIAALSGLTSNQPDRTADTAFIAGADTRWRSWVEQRRGLINSELSKCLAAQYHLRDQATRSLGKQQVVDELAARSRNERDAKLARKAN